MARRAVRPRAAADAPRLVAAVVARQAPPLYGRVPGNQTLGLLRNCTHVRNYNSHLSGLIPAGPQSSKLTSRQYYFPNASPYQLWSRSFASDSGDKFEAVVPFMGESVTDGNLARTHSMKLTC